jgi:hypothetical protein
VARAKQTARSEARRRYRQAAAQPDDEPGDELDAGEQRPEPPQARSTSRQGDRPTQALSGRPGFLSAFRAAYHPAHIAEDLRLLPMLLRSRAFLAAIGLVLLGAIAAFAFPGYTGSAFAWELLVWPGSALAPQLVAGFFAPRASYILGFLVGLTQGIVFTIFLTMFATRLGTTLPPDQVTNLLTTSFVSGPVLGTIFASAAAWYRRFLALSSPRRAPANRGSSGRASAKGNQSRRTAGR